MRIMQMGCFGTKNFGDEMSAKLIRGALPGHEWVLVGSGNHQLAAERHPEVRFINQHETDELLVELDRCDLVLFGPGTVLRSEVMPSVKHVIASKTPLIIVFAGAEEIETGSRGHELLKYASYVFMRDLASSRRVLAVVKDDDISKNIIGLFGDPIMTLRSESTSFDGPALLCVSWGLTQSPHRARVLSELRAMVRDHDSFSWKLIPAAWSDVDQSDFDDDRVFAQELGLEVITPVNYDELVTLVAAAPMVVSSRLHVVALALANNRPCIGFGPRKIAEFLSTVRGSEMTYAGEYGRFSCSGVNSAGGALRFEVSHQNSFDVLSESHLRKLRALVENKQ